MLRKAVDRITSALMYMDDSSGIVGDDLHGIMGLYARACAAAPPNPTGLARWLSKLLCDGPGWPRIVLRDSAPALGERGVAEVERLVARRAQTVVPQSWTGFFPVRDLRDSWRRYPVTATVRRRVGRASDQCGAGRTNQPRAA